MILFKSKKEISVEKHSEMISRMLRILSGNDDTVLYELLSVISPLFGECSLSIVRVSDRRIIAGTVTDASEKQGVQRLVNSVPELGQGMSRRYLRNEKNRLRFRPEYVALRVLPLKYASKIPYVLFAEQKENQEVSNIDDIRSMLAMAVQLYVSERDAENSKYVDAALQIGNRDALMKYMESTKYADNVTFMGMLFLKNEQELLLQHGYAHISGMMKNVAGIVERLFKGSVYRVGNGKLVVCMTKSLFDCVSDMQNMIDILCVNMTEGVFCSAVIKADFDKNFYKVLYLCERACTEAPEDSVVVVRESDCDWDNTVKDVYVSETEHV